MVANIGPHEAVSDSNSNRDTAAIDPLSHVRLVKRFVQIGVYLSIAAITIVYMTLLDMSVPQLMATSITGVIISTAAIEAGFWQILKVHRRSALPTTFAIELFAVNNLHERCDLAVSMACRWLGAKAAYLAWLDDRINSIPAASCGLGPHWFWQIPPPSPDDPAVHLAIERADITFAPTRDSTSFSTRFPEPSYTVTYLPLVAREQVIALFCLITDNKAAGARDRKLLQSLSVIIGLSLDNIRLSDRQYESVMKVLSRALDMRDHATEGHSQRVASLASLVAEQMGLPQNEVREIERAAALHDIGKIGVADATLSKPGALSDEEWVEMRKHPELGYQILRDIETFKHPAEIVYAHHERYDGKGYPRNLRREEIPLGARIFAVVDTYDAITSQRPYRPARTHAEAIDEIQRCSGSQFDPRVAQAFIRLMERLQPKDRADKASQPGEKRKRQTGRPLA